ncbi:hypothetical protein [Caballeronia calidae]|uniref:hypothetical protein n=1 Tax=Caballeronia calidae TaxID=1777139 RepID=UPI000787EF10|nr:hypothetical protein [Caballeronia calidae]
MTGLLAPFDGTLTEPVSEEAGLVVVFEVPLPDAGAVVVTDTADADADALPLRAASVDDALPVPSLPPPPPPHAASKTLIEAARVAALKERED